MLVFCSFVQLYTDLGGTLETFKGTFAAELNVFYSLNSKLIILKNFSRLKGRLVSSLFSLASW